MAVNLLRNACAISIYFRTFAPDMNGSQKETLRVRIISVGITCLAFVVFKPIGLGALGLMLYLHFLAIWVLWGRCLLCHRGCRNPYPGHADIA